MTRRTSAEGGLLAFHLLLLALGMVGALLLAAALAHGHGPHMTLAGAPAAVTGRDTAHPGSAAARSR
jgi:hypothetical protein